MLKPWYHLGCVEYSSLACISALHRNQRHKSCVHWSVGTDTESGLHTIWPAVLYSAGQKKQIVNYMLAIILLFSHCAFWVDACHVLMYFLSICIFFYPWRYVVWIALVSLHLLAVVSTNATVAWLTATATMHVLLYVLLQCWQVVIPGNMFTTKKTRTKAALVVVGWHLHYST